MYNQIILALAREISMVKQAGRGDFLHRVLNTGLKGPFINTLGKTPSFKGVGASIPSALYPSPAQVPDVANVLKLFKNMRLPSSKMPVWRYAQVPPWG